MLTGFDEQRFFAHFAPVDKTPFFEKREAACVGDQIGNAAGGQRVLLHQFPEIRHGRRQKDRFTVQQLGDIGYRSQARLEIFRRHHMRFIKDNNAVRHIMQLAEPVSFILVDRFKKLNGSRHNDLRVPVFRDAPDKRFVILVIIRVIYAEGGLMAHNGGAFAEQLF